MKNYKNIQDIDNYNIKLISKMCRTDYNEFRALLERSLHDQNIQPLIVTTVKESIENFFINIYRRANDTTLHQSFQKALYDLLAGWSKQIHSIDYLYRLIFICGKLKITDSEKIIHDFFKNSTMRQIIGKNTELLKILLSTLAGIRPYSTKTIQLFKQYIKNDNVNFLCFRCLAINDVSYSFNYIKYIVKRDAQLPQLNYLFNSLILDLGIEAILEMIPMYFNSISDESIKIFKSLDLFFKYNVKINYEEGYITFTDNEDELHKISVYFDLDVLKRKGILNDFDNFWNEFFLNMEELENE